MKTIKCFENFVAERKAAGILYHFTDLNSLEGIFEENRMVSSALYDYISFTRNYTLGTSSTWKSNSKNVRITFDGDLMSNRFSFSPFLYDPEKDPLFGNPQDKGIDSRRKSYGDEREERIMKKEIPNIKRYILQVDILSRGSGSTEKENMKYLKDQERIQELRKNNPEIDFNFVSSLVPFHWKTTHQKIAA